MSYLHSTTYIWTSYFVFSWVNVTNICFCVISQKRLIVPYFLLSEEGRLEATPFQHTGYVRPLLEYSDVIWHSSITTKQSNMLESIQRRACRITLGLNYISYKHALNFCNLVTLSCRREAHCLKFASSLCRSERTSKLIPPTRFEVHGRQLRNSSDITQLSWHTKRFATSPVPYFIDLLNSS